MLNRPLAYLSRSGGRLPRPKVTAGATANTCGKPRRTCGTSSSPPPHSWVMKLKLHIDRPKRARPNIISQRSVESARQQDVDRHADQRGGAGREDRDAGLPGAEAAHIAEKQRRQIDRREDADAGDEREHASEREIAVAERAQIDDRLGEGQAADDEQRGRRSPRSRRRSGSSRRRTSSSASLPPARIPGCRGRSPAARCPG